MIDSTNLTSDLSARLGAKGLAPILQQIATRADLNHDGKVTSAEFSQFLNHLTASIDAEHQGSASGASSASAVAASLSAVSKGSASAIVAALKSAATAMAKGR